MAEQFNPKKKSGMKKLFAREVDKVAADFVDCRILKSACSPVFQ